MAPFFQVSGDGGVSGRASQVLSVLVGDVLALAIFVALGEPEVDDVDVVAGRLGASNQEVVRLDITVDHLKDRNAKTMSKKFTFLAKK